MTSQKIRLIQEALKEKGYDPGPIDNVLGEEIHAAIKQFRADKSLPVGGVNLKTLGAPDVEIVAEPDGAVLGRNQK